MKLQSLIKNVLLGSHPVGTIYMTTDSSFNPQVSWGGQWVRVSKDRFLVGAGENYSSEQIGGQYTHAHATQGHQLTVNEMPSHTHGNWDLGAYNGGSTNYGGIQITTWASGQTTGATGGNASHSHGDTGEASSLPPYYAVYMWKRIA